MRIGPASTLMPRPTAVLDAGGAAVHIQDTPSDNNVVGASARLRRAPEYTAPKPCGSVNNLGRVGGAWLTSSCAGAASPTSERYAQAQVRLRQ
jgi:hypothetical protein